MGNFRTVQVEYFFGIILTIETPVFSSPFLMAWKIGAAPLHLGSKLA